jgi:hypothetical protein
MMGRIFLATMVAALFLLAAALAFAITKGHAPPNEPFRLRSSDISVPIEVVRSRSRPNSHDAPDSPPLRL